MSDTTLSIVLILVPIVTGLIVGSFWGVLRLEKRVDKLEEKLK